MIGNKYLLSIENKLKFTREMIKIEMSIDAESAEEAKAYKEIPKLLKQIKKHLASNDIDSNADYELYMQCKTLIAYWD